MSERSPALLLILIIEISYGVLAQGEKTSQRLQASREQHRGMNNQLMASLRELSPLPRDLTLNMRNNSSEQQNANWAKNFLKELGNESGHDSRSDSGSTDGNMQATLLPHGAHLAYSAFSWASDITSDMGDPFFLSLAHNKKQAMEDGKYLQQTDNKALFSQEQRQTLNFSLPRYLQTTKTPATSFHSSNSPTFHNNMSKLPIPVSPSFAEEDAENGHQCERQDGLAASKDMGRAEEESNLENFIAHRESEDATNLYKSKRHKLTETPSPSSLVPSKSREPQSRGKEKFGDKITALQQLVSPFGKSDTASVLMEAIGYIKFLQDQVQVLSSPYMKPISRQGQGDEKGDMVHDLKSRGLCLVPVSCTMHVANSNGADFWTSGISGGGSRHY